MDGGRSNAFGEIQGLLARHYDIIARQGRPVIGWFCSYTPGEILAAAGLGPYRILPEPGWAIARADGCLDRNFCPYVRTCLGEALEGKYRFLDGLVVVNSCDAMRRLYDVWRYNVGGGFNFLLDLPRINSAAAVDYFRECLQGLVAEVERHFHVSVTDAALAGAIASSNRMRSSLRELYRLNREKGYPLAAAQVHTVVRAGMVLPASAFQGRLEGLLGELEDSPADKAGGPRILITGSLMDNPQILELIERDGAKVVGDDLCSGMRLFLDDVETSAEPLADLSRHYLGRAPCPRMQDASRRYEYVLRRVDELRVDGVIFYTFKFCDPFLYDLPLLRERLVARGVATLLLEGDYTPGTLGGARTRVEAFIEMLRQHVRAA